jgi:magnesium chelatase subunit D
MSAGIDAALALALDARKRGHTPVVVLMTDGRANVARDGSYGDSAATDATSSARALRDAGVCALFLDTAPRPRAEARALAIALGARYVPLPYVDAAGISRHVQALAAEVAK